MTLRSFSVLCMNDPILLHVVWCGINATNTISNSIRVGDSIHPRPPLGRRFDPMNHCFHGSIPLRYRESCVSNTWTHLTSYVRLFFQTWHPSHEKKIIYISRLSLCMCIHMSNYCICLCIFMCICLCVLWVLACVCVCTKQTERPAQPLQPWYTTNPYRLQLWPPWHQPGNSRLTVTRPTLTGQKDS